MKNENFERLSTRLDGLIAKLQIFPYCVMLASTYVIALAIFSFLVVRLGLRDSWLYLFMIPAVLAAFYFKHRIYLSMLGALFVAAVWVTSLVSSDFSASLTTIAVSSFSGVIIAEVIHILVTSRKRMEEALRESKEHYQRLVELSSGLIAIHRDGRFVYINRAGVNLLGFSSPDQVIGRLMTDFITPAQRDASDEQVQRLLRDGQQSPVYGQTIIRPDGSRREVEVVGVPITYQDETAVQIIAHDVTERKRAEEALQESKERLDLALRGADLGMWDWNVQTGAVVFNERWANMLGYKLDEIEPNVSSWEKLLHPDDAPEVLEALNAHLEGQTPTYRTEHRLRTKSGDWKWVWDTGKVLVRDEKGRPVRAAGIHQDITGRKRAEEAIRNSLREKEVLLREIHHRVKNNLQVISSLLRLQSQHTNDEQARAALEESQNRVRAMTLVHEKLYQSPNLDRIDFAEYLRSLTTHLIGSYRGYARSVALRVDVADAMLSLDKAIPCGLIVSELVTNALKHAFPPRENGEIHIALRPENEHWILSVGNDGISFPEDLEIEKTDSLGLQLVVMLTRQLRGTLTLDRDGGTRFEITFPMDIEDGE